MGRVSEKAACTWAYRAASWKINRLGHCCNRQKQPANINFESLGNTILKIRRLTNLPHELSQLFQPPPAPTNGDSAASMHGFAHAAAQPAADRQIVS